MQRFNDAEQALIDVWEAHTAAEFEHKDADAAIATDYLLHLTTGVIAGLRVDAARMRANLESTGGLIYTSSVLLDLVAAGMSREDAYALVLAAAAGTTTASRPRRRSGPSRSRSR